MAINECNPHFMIKVAKDKEHTSYLLRKKMHL